MCRQKEILYFNFTKHMKPAKMFPILSIKLFDDYTHCDNCEKSFYIKQFDRHLKENYSFLDNPHGHDFFIILLITKGSGLHHIDLQTYNVEPGTLFIIAPGQIHNWELSDDAGGYIMFYTKEFLLSEFHSDQLRRLPFFHTTFQQPCIHVNEPELNKLSVLFQNIEKLYEEKEKYSHEMIRLYIKIITLEIEKKYAEPLKEHIISHQQNMLGKFEELVELHYRDHLSVIEYANRLNLSLKQLSTLCRKYVNKTPGELIQDRLLLESKRLLLHSDMSITAVSEELRFSEYSYFIRVFKRYTAYTPEQFRKNQNILTRSDLKS